MEDSSLPTHDAALSRSGVHHLVLNRMVRDVLEGSVLSVPEHFADGLRQILDFRFLDMFRWSSPV